MKNCYYYSMGTSKIKIVFDLDGTIFSSSDILEPSYSSVIQRCNSGWNTSYLIPSAQKIISLVGRPGKEIIATLFPQMTLKQQKIISDSVLVELIRRIRNREGKIFPDVPSVLKKLQDAGFTLFIVSNCRRAYLEAILETYKLEKFFFSALCNEDDPSAGKAGLLKKVLNKSKGVMIGDRASDGEAARFASVPWIGCAFGHASSELQKADAIIHSFSELPEAIGLVI